MKPISNVDAERSILGAILLDSDAFYQTDTLSSMDFSLESHRKIYGAMTVLCDEQKPVDIVTLHEQLNRSKEIDIIGGVAYLSSLTEGMPRGSNIIHYVRIVREYSQKRKLAAVLTRALSQIEDAEYGVTVSDLISKADKEILSIQGNEKFRPRHISEVLTEVDQDIAEERSIDPDKETIGYRTGLKELDAMTCGYHKREMTIIGGWTSDGKSVLMKQGVLAQMCDDNRVLVFTREVSRQQFGRDLK